MWGFFFLFFGMLMELGNTEDIVLLFCLEISLKLWYKNDNYQPKALGVAKALFLLSSIFS